MTSLKHVVLLELKDSIVIIPKMRDFSNDNEIKKNKKILSLTSNLFDDLNKEITEIGFYRTTLNGDNLELRGGIKTKNTGMMNIYFSFKVNVKNFMKEITNKFEKILKVANSIDYSLVKKNNHIYNSYISFKQLNNLKKFSSIFNLEEFEEEDYDNLFDLDFKNIHFSTSYNINTNTYRFCDLRTKYGMLYPANLTNLDFLDFNVLIGSCFKLRSDNNNITKIKFKLICYLIKKLSKKEDRYRNFIADFEKKLIAV